MNLDLAMGLLANLKVPLFGFHGITAHVYTKQYN
jgi:hypothetical protein